MQQTWTYKQYEITEGLKPGSKTFRFFFKVLEGAQKKCNYCVWLMDDALAGFDASEDFKAIADSQKANWHAWVKQKLDAGDFRNRALKFTPAGQEEINLSEMSQHVSVD